MASIANDGEVAISVAAAANGETGATAVANIDRGIGNYAAALGSGDAIASIANTGDINISAGAARPSMARPEQQPQSPSSATRFSKPYMHKVASHRGISIIAERSKLLPMLPRPASPLRRSPRRAR